ncbi:type VII secretion integral membrane protein EccD [Kineosporia sp. J2-2]|uniref:Type VII secretion integral membrane protein EccD n=1 Tax=Kineosporia corallincola TaxID=2835133 RepID=A0ABS5TGG2_9ACTN|nr:type VII secretion integral membrane protein EccD [Kineosporia corallincola]MBT0770191.1 type VII secretion integral membrane protein EccD [Kineosporia corallincola]
MAVAKATTTSSGEVCRLTICGPDTRIELAVPAHVPMADLMPTFLGYLGPDLAQSGLAHDGWVLQRLGEAPMDEDLAAAALGLYDGDVIHLRPRNDQLPPVDFDDLVDGVATGIAERGDRWRPDVSGRLLTGLAGVVLLAALTVVPGAGSGTAVAVIGGVAGLVAGLAALGAARALGEKGAGRLLMMASLAFLAVAGLALPVGAHDFLSGPFTGAGVLASASVVAAVALCTGFVLGRTEPGFTAAGLCAVPVALAGLLRTLDWAEPSGAASVVLALSLIGTVQVAMLASRLAGLRIPPLPTNTDEFQQGIDPEPSHLVLSRTTQADRYVTALSTGLAAVQTGCLILLGSDPDVWARVLTGVAALLILLHARDLLGIRARLAVMVPGVAGPATLILAETFRQPDDLRPIVVALLLVLAGVMLVLAWTLPGRAMLPHWGRAGDLVQSGLAIAVIPLVPAVLGLYARVRGGW